MFRFLQRKKLKKVDATVFAQLMYVDVSSDRWDQENLTKRNLDFSVDSIHYIDAYATRLAASEAGATQLRNHFDSFVIRLGAYIGEVIKRNSQQDFAWYDFDSVYHHSAKLANVHKAVSDEIVLYSQSRDEVLFPFSVVRRFLEGNSPYPSFLAYVDEVMKEHR
ncbi:hypothetical protein [Brevibacillus reuszeri]|uniref:hypothetical protein n=1 Tax=Brevibacillus reuszeri TaxID=54915 RepID=UPI00289E41AA|nr:hypothetical protein [Brevibacillus reuszeri]